VLGAVVMRLGIAEDVEADDVDLAAWVAEERAQVEEDVGVRVFARRAGFVLAGASAPYCAFGEPDRSVPRPWGPLVPRVGGRLDGRVVDGVNVAWIEGSSAPATA
jgi:hypothetical protein